MLMSTVDINFFLKLSSGQVRARSSGSQRARFAVPSLSSHLAGAAAVLVEMAAKASDAYAVLGVKPKATARQIKAAYLREARVHHPDRNAGDALAATERFKMAVSAYEALKDPRRRRAYDLTLRQRRRQSTAGENKACGANGCAAKHIERTVLCTLEELYNGVRCKAVDGDGKLVVRIEAGCAAGDVLALGPGCGHCTVREAPHRVFRRVGDDLHLVLPISMEDALCGSCALRVPTLAHGAPSTALAVEPLRASSDVRVVVGAGFPLRGRRGQFGDLQIRFVIALVPPPLRSRERARGELRALREKWACACTERDRASDDVQSVLEAARLQRGAVKGALLGMTLKITKK
jgi:DnaJ-class molecular chaperone